MMIMITVEDNITMTDDRVALQKLIENVAD